jgi:hypothetical protein
MRAWTELSRGLRGVLSLQIKEHSAIDWILSDLKSCFMTITQSFNFSANCPANCEPLLNEAGKAFQDFLRENTNQWLLQMVMLEIELYGAKFG